jgi:hypothetical protein
MKQDQSNRNRTNTTDRKAAVTKQRADFVSTARGNSSYMERNWARIQPWAAVERPDLHHSPLLTPEARHFLEQERNHAANGH